MLQSNISFHLNKVLLSNLECTNFLYNDQSCAVYNILKTTS